MKDRAVDQPFLKYQLNAFDSDSFHHCGPIIGAYCVKALESSGTLRALVRGTLAVAYIAVLALFSLVILAWVLGGRVFHFCDNVRLGFKKARSTKSSGINYQQKMRA